MTLQYPVDSEYYDNLEQRGQVLKGLKQYNEQGLKQCRAKTLHSPSLREYSLDITEVRLDLTYVYTISNMRRSLDGNGAIHMRVYDDK